MAAWCTVYGHQPGPNAVCLLPTCGWLFSSEYKSSPYLHRQRRRQKRQRQRMCSMADTTSNQRPHPSPGSSHSSSSPPQPATRRARQAGRQAGDRAGRPYPVPLVWLASLRPQWLRMMLGRMAAGTQQEPSSCVTSQMWSRPPRRPLRGQHQQGTVSDQPPSRPSNFTQAGRQIAAWNGIRCRGGSNQGAAAKSPTAHPPTRPPARPPAPG